MGTRILCQSPRDLRLWTIGSMADGILKFDDVKWCTYRLDAIGSCRLHAVLVEYGVVYVEHEAEHLALGHACGTQHSEFAGGKVG